MNIDEQLIDQNIAQLSSNNNSLNETIISNVLFKRLSSKHFVQKINTFTVLDTFNDINIISADNSSILFIEDTNCRIEIEQSIGAVKKFITLDSRM